MATTTSAADPAAAGTWTMGDRTVKRMGYGAMQLAGPGVFGPPRDHDGAIAVLHAAMAAGIDHIDTSDYYGPYVTNRLIKEALHPYPASLTLVTKLGGRRNDKGEWLGAFSADELRRGVESNLENLGLNQLEIVNLRSLHGRHAAGEGPLDEQMETLAVMQQEGLIRHIGMSNVTRKQIEDGQKIAPVVCVQNAYNLANRADDDLIVWLADQGIAYVPFFPLGGFTLLQSAELDAVAAEVQATPMQVALAWLLQRSPNVLLIPGTSSLVHLHENIAAASLKLTAAAVARLDAIAG
ncbi:oxidoreductase [Novosphingobium sp.]|uniref:oxidoreductase n=1 Tax=Novosphingobium sp. TaxID=1874826 RepID=UPI0025FBC092|nr:oxidoreductase [Novosphingobium sp.]